MDAQAVTLLATLKRPTASSEAKLAALNSLKSDIKHYRVPESALSTIFECLKLAITQQASSTLASSGFSALGHLIKRLHIQDPTGNTIVQLAPRLFPALEDRLGDMRDSMRSAASQALSDFFPFCTAEVEEIIRESAICGSNPRAKQSGMLWVLRMHKDESMPFKSYVQAIVARLEDADGTVRETAKTTLIDLFRDAPDRAQADLKRQLKAFSVRTSIETQILSQLGPNAAPAAKLHNTHREQDVDMAASIRSQSTVDQPHNFADSTSGETAHQQSAEKVQIEPLYVHSRSELDEIFRTMLPSFEGRETEHNWTPRDKAILKVRRLNRGNAPSEYHVAFMAGVKSLVEGILKVANSLRTTMSTNGCQLVQELAQTLGPALDPHVEMFLQAFIKMSAATKHIAAENGRTTADAIFQNCSYNSRMMQHIWSAAQEKNVQVRQCTPEWLKTILRRQASYKTHFESSGGLDLAEKCISKCLDDANPKVKESMRATYWEFAKTWPDKARIIMSKLDPKTKAALERDPSNPNASLLRSHPIAAVPSRTTGAASRNTLREMMAQKRRAKEAGMLPDRPNSAMAELSPAKPRSVGTASRGTPHLSHSTTAESRTVSTASTQHETTTAGRKGSSLMSGPVRRPRRPELSRPQTADPYASRRMMRPETPANSTPVNSPPKGTGTSAKSQTASSMARSRAKTANLHTSPSITPGRSTARSGHVHPVHAHPARSHGQDSRPGSKGSDNDLSSVREDDFTMVMPSIGPRGPVYAPGYKRPGLAQSASVDSRAHISTSDEDVFTMVMPNLPSNQEQLYSPTGFRSPLKAMFEEAREKMMAMSPKVEEVGRSPKPEHTPNTGTPRSSSPAKTTAVQHEEVQIYEDPFVAEDQGTQSRPERKVLGELPVNENVPMLSSAQSSGSAPGSPRHDTELRSPTATTSQDRAETLRNRRLLASGIERIGKRTLDAHGFRRVQELAKSPLDIWDGGRTYDELMSVVLHYLQTFDAERPPVGTTPSNKATGLKAQALNLARTLLTLPRHSKAAASWHSKALVTILACNGPVDGVSLVAADLERAADDIIKQAAPETCIDAIVEALPTFAAATAAAGGTSRSTAMSLVVLRRLLESAQRRRIDLGSQRKVQLVRTTAMFLDDGDAEVRKADVELASELFELFGSSKAEFWNEYRGTDEGRLGLLTYYIARRGKTAASPAPAAAQGVVQ